jgi:hypothetical protein
MSKNRILPVPPTVGSSRKTMKARAVQGPIMFLETDLSLPGIVKETNNYPIVGIKQAVSYYDPLDYYDEEGGSSYYIIKYI